MATGYAVPPAEATHAFARRAEAAGATVVLGSAAGAGGRARGRRRASRPARGRRRSSTRPAPGGRSTALWGVNVEVHLPAPPRHAVEEAGIDALLAAGGGEDGLFALVTARPRLLARLDVPRPTSRTRRRARRGCRQRGARFVPALADAPIVSVRACARPRSADGRPLLGPPRRRRRSPPGTAPWGISLGPASARLVADLVLGREPAIPPELDPARFA